MSQYLINDIVQLHTKMKVNAAVRSLSPEMLKEFLNFRINFLVEELNETMEARDAKDWPEVVDGLVDLVVVALGTLDAFDVDTNKAWNLVHEANFSKSPGIKPERPNKYGLPDMIKPANFVAPDHTDNVGLLSKIQ